MLLHGKHKLCPNCIKQILKDICHKGKYDNTFKCPVIGCRNNIITDKYSVFFKPVEKPQPQPPPINVSKDDLQKEEDKKIPPPISQVRSAIIPKKTNEIETLKGNSMSLNCGHSCSNREILEIARAVANQNNGITAVRCRECNSVIERYILISICKEDGVYEKLHQMYLVQSKLFTCSYCSESRLLPCSPNIKFSYCTFCDKDICRLCRKERQNHSDSACRKERKTVFFLF